MVYWESNPKNWNHCLGTWLKDEMELRNSSHRHEQLIQITSEKAFAIWILYIELETKAIKNWCMKQLQGWAGSFGAKRSLRLWLCFALCIRYCFPLCNSCFFSAWWKFLLPHFFSLPLVTIAYYALYLLMFHLTPITNWFSQFILVQIPKRGLLE